MKLPQLIIGLLLVILAGLGLSLLIDDSPLTAPKEVELQSGGFDRWPSVVSAMEESVRPKRALSRLNPFSNEEATAEALESFSSSLTDKLSRNLKEVELNSPFFIVSPTRFNSDAKTINVTIEVGSSVRTSNQPNLYAAFLASLCPAWIDTQFGQDGYALLIRLQRSNGTLILSESISQTRCNRYRDFQARRQGD